MESWSYSSVCMRHVHLNFHYRPLQPGRTFRKTTKFFCFSRDATGLKQPSMDAVITLFSYKLKPVRVVVVVVVGVEGVGERTKGSKKARVRREQAAETGANLRGPSVPKWATSRFDSPASEWGGRGEMLAGRRPGRQAEHNSAFPENNRPCLWIEPASCVCRLTRCSNVKLFAVKRGK